jgi:hypothetical protein
MKRNQYNAVYKLQDLFEYPKECHSNLPTHVFEDLGEIIHDLKNPEGGTLLPHGKIYYYNIKYPDASIS